MTRRFFRRADWFAALATFLFSGWAFYFHMAPEVTLQDSGELVTGAFTFGVPHPPGYPIWAFLGYIWSNFIVPFGNPAWRIGTMSVFTGAATVSILTLLMIRSTRVLLHTLPWAQDIDEKMQQWIAFGVGISTGLLFGFNRGVWLWASVSEMRVLNAFSFILIAYTFFAWMIQPKRLGFLYASLLIYGLSMTNHQTVAVMVGALIVGTLALGLDDFLKRREGLPPRRTFADDTSLMMSSLTTFWDLLVAVLLSIAAVFILFAWLNTPANVHEAILKSWSIKEAPSVASLALWRGITFIGVLGAIAFAEFPLRNINGWFRKMVALFVIAVFLVIYWTCAHDPLLMKVTEQDPPLSRFLVLYKSEMSTAMALMVAGFLLLGVFSEKGWVRPRYALLYTVLILCGCAFYFYMPVAASTNPPMNWGYAATKEGFLHAIKRGQYEAVRMADPCGKLIMTQLWIFTRGLGRQYSWVLTLFGLGSLAMATVWMTKKLVSDARKHLWLLIVWLAAIPMAVIGIMALRYVFLINPSRQNPEALRMIKDNYNSVVLIFWGLALPTLLCMIIGLWLYLRQLGRAWMIFVWTAFLVTSLGLIMIINPKVDAQEQQITLKFFAPAHGFFAMLIGYGVTIALVAIRRLWRQMPREVMLLLCLGCLAFPCITYHNNWELCSMRTFDFGYQFGYRMFNPGGGYPDMTRDAVLFGGTDPGRFVPTYLILCESFVKPDCRYVSPWMPLDEKALRSGIQTLEKDIQAFRERETRLDGKIAAIEKEIAAFGNKAGNEKKVKSRQEERVALHQEKEGVNDKTQSLRQLIERLQDRINNPDEDAGAKRQHETQRMRDFDRRDVYIITQNALADTTYMSYIRDHYDYTRPRVDENGKLSGTITNKPAWQQSVFKAGWTLLDRQNTYPKKPIRIPTPDDSAKAFQQFVEDVRAGRGPPNVDLKIEGGRVQVSGAVSVMEINAILSKWIFDWNKDSHDFYVEESYVIQWMYPYLRPAGVIMKIERDPLPGPQWNSQHTDLIGLWKEIVEQDTAYWDRLTDDFLAREEFRRSLDAKKSFAKMRSAIAGLYLSRGMIPQAEYAFRQSVKLCPESPEGCIRLAELYRNLRRYEDARTLMADYLEYDRYNASARGFLNHLEDLAKSDKRRIELQEKIKADGAADPNDAMELLMVYARMGLQGELRHLGTTMLSNTNAPPHYFFELGSLLSSAKQLDLSLQALTHYTAQMPRDPVGWIELGWVYLLQKKDQEGYNAWLQAVRLGGEKARVYLRDDPRFAPFWQQKELLKPFLDLIPPQTSRSVPRLGGR
ncbi:MAG: DUF2723 domain-containing protein [Kiritimatiellaeota bacterium]|nr:DUF2723 domain-containing protein [Kiritimatiellota bacterium]